MYLEYLHSKFYSLYIGQASTFYSDVSARSSQTPSIFPTHFDMSAKGVRVYWEESNSNSPKELGIYSIRAVAMSLNNNGVDSDNQLYISCDNHPPNAN
jgi:hypothetical protein